MLPRAILFDLDDTLLDRPRSMERFLLRFRRDHGEALGVIDDAALLAALSVADDSGYRSREAMFAMILETVPWRLRPAVEHLIAHWRENFPDCTIPMDGLHDVLTELRARGVRTGVITNGPEDAQHAKIDRVGIRSLLDTIVVSGSVGFAKPDPRIFAHAVDAVAVLPADAWFVGDNPLVDVVGADEAGLSGVWLRGRVTWPNDVPHPSRAIDTLTELLDLV